MYILLYLILLFIIYILTFYYTNSYFLLYTFLLFSIKHVYFIIPNLTQTLDTSLIAQMYNSLTVFNSI